MKGEEQIAIVAGALGGIGRAICIKLAQAGYSIVALHHKTPQEEVDTFLTQLSGNGHQSFRADLADEGSLQTLVSQIKNTHKHVGVVIQAAVSPLIRKNIFSLTPQELRADFEVTVFGTCNLFSAFLPLLLDQRSGVIIALTTEALDSGKPQGPMSGYIIAKHALKALLAEYARQGLQKKIMVNAVAPPFVNTPLHADLPEVVRAFVLDKLPSATVEMVADKTMEVLELSKKGVTGRSFSVGGGEGEAFGI